MRFTTHAHTSTGRVTLRVRNKAGDTTAIRGPRLPKPLAAVWPLLAAQCRQYAAWKRGQR